MFDFRLSVVTQEGRVPLFKYYVVSTSGDKLEEVLNDVGRRPTTVVVSVFLARTAKDGMPAGYDIVYVDTKPEECGGPRIVYPADTGTLGLPVDAGGASTPDTLTPAKE